MSTIFLCGFMGCGKSTVGRELAKLLNCNFIDMDIYIEEKEKMPIPEIFSNHGEPYFRSLEAEAIIELSGKNCIVATGGGALIPEKNAVEAKKNGKIIYINTNFEECYKRIANDKNRPLAASRTKESLLELFNARTPIYFSHSDISVNGNDTPANIAVSIKNSLLNK